MHFNPLKIQTRAGERGHTSRIPSNRNIPPIPPKAPNKLPRPLQRQSLIPKPVVAGGFTHRGRVVLEFRRVDEAEDVEAVGGHDYDGVDGGFREEAYGCEGVGGAELEPAAV